MRQQSARNYNQRSERKTNYYIDGNTVRRLEGEPEERRRRQIEKEQEQTRRKNCRVARRNQERALRVSLGYVLFCTIAVCLLGCVCVTYIQLQSDITARTRNISGLERQISDLRADNAAAIKRLDLSTDLEKIREQALGFGMKYANESQIVYYGIEDHDFMEQHSDIPEE